VNPKAVGPTIATGMQEAGKSRRVTIELFEVADPLQFAEAFAAMGRQRVEGLIVIADPLTVSHRTQIVDLARRERIATRAGFGEFARAGGLMSYGLDLADHYRRGATFVDKIFKGAKPADLPVEQPTKFELVINRKTAKALGLTIPRSILLRADQVIE